MAAGAQGLRFVVGEELAGQRIDQALAALADVPRSQVKHWLEDGRVRVSGEIVRRAGRRVWAGDVLDADPPEPVAMEARPEAIAIEIVYEDEDLVVVDKAPGMVVHPAPGHRGGTLVNALLHHCHDLAGVGGVARPGIVHRLDKGTSGILVVAKHDRAHLALSEQFQDHSIERIYLAFVRGQPGREEGRIEKPIGRHPRDRKRMSVRAHHGRAAITNWRVLERYAASSHALLELRPETGRTHQLRVHLASSGMPITGDPVYGRARRSDTPAGLSRPALHAAVLGFVHPRRGEQMRFEAPLPEDLLALQRALEAREERS